MKREKAIEHLNNARDLISEEVIDMAIEALQEVQKHEETFEWCTDCKEYDKDNYCCHRWSKTIRNTVEELKTYRPQGEWVKAVDDGVWSFTDAYAECDQCHKVTFNGWNMNYCPNCGADMRKEGERTMSVSKWSYTPEKCDGDYCCGDCDYCSKSGEDE